MRGGTDVVYLPRNSRGPSTRQKIDVAMYRNGRAATRESSRQAYLHFPESIADGLDLAIGGANTIDESAQRKIWVHPLPESR